MYIQPSSQVQSYINKESSHVFQDIFCAPLPKYSQHIDEFYILNPVRPHPACAGFHFPSLITGTAVDLVLAVHVQEQMCCSAGLMMSSSTSHFLLGFITPGREAKIATEVCWQSKVGGSTSNKREDEKMV